MIFDTDVLIWALRGHREAARFIQADEAREFAIVSYMELLRGAHDRHDTRAIQAFLTDLEFRSLPLTERIGHRAADYMEQYALKVDLDIADALIAATAVENGLVLATGNKKHFSVIEGLRLRVFRPS